MKLLFVGDVVGGVGRRALAALLPGLRESHQPDWVVVNGENTAGGVGVTEKTARDLFELGVDAITLGNEFEISEYSRDDLIYTKDILLAEPIKRVPVADPVRFDTPEPAYKKES